MSLAEVRRILGDPRGRLEGNAPVVPLDACAFLESGAVPKGLGIMLAKGRVVRIDVFESGIRTASGVGVGDAEDKVELLYPGRITVEPHHYDPAGHYLRYSPSDVADREYGMVFETDGEKVISFRTGTVAALALVEACS